MGVKGNSMRKRRNTVMGARAWHFLCNAIEQASVKLLRRKLLLRGVEDVKSKVREVIGNGDVGWVPSECDLTSLFGGQEDKYRNAIKDAADLARKVSGGTNAPAMISR